MSKLVSDALVDSISISANQGADGARRIVRIDGPPELMVVASTLGFFSPSELTYVASGVRDQEGIGTNGTGFRYPTDELDPGEEPLEGVEVYNPLGEVQMGVPAFERLMARYFRSLIDGANAARHSMTREPWWPEFLAMIEEIEGRVRREAVG